MTDCTCTTDTSFAASLHELGPLLKTLADANRLKLVCMLTKHEHCVCELMELTGLAQNLVSHHLGVLKKVGLVQSRREGTKLYYSIDAQKVERTMETFNRILSV